MKKQTAVEWLVEEMLATDWWYLPQSMKQDIIEQAKSMENKEKLKYQLFMGKVSDILGFDKTVELLKQCNDEIR